ncbi:BspA family leucine-rich repeat surface protein [Fulvivirga lutea]|uniref:BspA family leucine-rich repeat surface protein n=1 Tax=Fulvivirga lutea TaxID=2810512 RepID=A0A975A353_9BACT|nr:BspA family leucine-rich repeat surface protein [Fulvivirga lutea]QSE99252.1 BspA family leucine-rich repeat surface protein [Fulvivirga lutea]
MNKFTHTLFMLLVTYGLAQSQAFVTTWKTDNPGSSNDNQITIPTTGTGYNYTVNWGDGSSDAGVTGNITHTYTSPGIYTLSISGDFPRIYFNDSGDKDKILTIEQWGAIEWTSMMNAFFGCSNVTSNASDAPNLTNVSTIQGMFSKASSFNGDLNNWDVSNVSIMYATFFRASSFNGDISNWDVSNVNNMSYMFAYASAFNQNLNDWDVSNVSNFEMMFRQATSFDQPLDEWDVSNASNFSHMFRESGFNQDLTTWITTAATNMSAMFFDNSSFNGDVSGFDMNGVTNTASMFSFADNFDQNLAGWDVSTITNMTEMFNNSGLSTTNYDNLLVGWAPQSVQSGVQFGASGTSFCHSSTERDNLINDHGWVFTDAGQECLPFITTWKTDNPGTSAANQITIPVKGGVIYNYDVDWGDGSSDTGVNGSITHTYASAGTYTVQISGDFPHIYFNFGGDKEKLLTIEQWGDIKWSSMEASFGGCTNLTSDATDAPNLSNVTSLERTFTSCSNFNGDVSNWDTSTITEMIRTFHGATIFNQDISDWNTSNVTIMQGMFQEAVIFNQDISGWDVSNLERANYMFYKATSFNQDLSGWNMSKAININSMFHEASSFNQDISGWNVSNAVRMDEMFHDASAFNQDLSSWDISSVTHMPNMFDDSGLSQINYDKILQGWAAQTVQPNVTLGALNVDYCLGSTARNTLLAGPNNWTINDGNENCVVNIPDANFKAALLANGSINTDGDPTEISYQEAEVINNLQLAGLNISDLTGIEAFTALNVLAANNNNLTSIDLTNNESLDYLSLSGNDLTEIDLSNNPTLIEVILSNNQLTEIDLGNNGQITTLWVDQNDITSIDLSNNLLLEDLRLDRNPNLSGLNISVNDQLTVLHAYSCNISNLNVSNNTLLEGLFIYGNPITAINLSGLTNLDDLRVGGLSISTLDLSDNPNLRFLRASGMGLTSLTLEGSSLVQLFVQNNNLSGALDLSMFPNLTTVRIEQNDFNELDLRNGNNVSISNFNTTSNPNLTCISVDDVAFAEANFTNIDAQTEFSTNCNAVHIPDTNFKTALLANTSINTIDDGEITFDEAEAFTGTINVANGSISDLTGIEAFINITRLFCSQNQLTALDISQNTALTVLSIRDNQISSLNLSNNVALVEVDLTSNQLTSLDVTNCPALVDLGFDNNQLTSIDLSNNASLAYLFCENNQLTELDVSNNTSLIELFCLGNEITSLDLSQHADLQYFDCNDNQLTELNIANGNNIDIQSFDATNNPNLTCITVDDVAYAEANFTDVDEAANFSTNCSNTTNDILTFSFTEQAIDAIIDDINHTVVIDVVSGTDFTNLTPTFTVSAGASANPASGVAQDFSSDFVYTVTAENPTAIQEWTVTVREENTAPSDIALDNNTIDENNDIDAVVGTFSTTDVDASDTHTYALVAGTGDSDNASFDLSGSDLIALESFDFETKASYSIRVQTDDGRGGTFEKEFTISINDVEDRSEQTITFEPIESQFFEAGSVTLSASASSGLTVSFDIVSGPATVSGNVVSFTDLGTVVVSASQAGDAEFLPAVSVEQTFEVITVTGFEEAASALLVYPNPASDVLTVQTQQENVSLRLLNLNGSEVMEVRPNVSNDISQLDNGIYFLLISNSQGVITHKIIKQ